MSSHLTSLVSESTRAGNIDLASLIQDEYGESMLEVGVAKKVLPQLAENGDYGDQRQNIRLVVSIRSREMVRDYEKRVVKVWAFGRSVINKSNYKMLVIETMKVDGVKRGHTIEMETETFENVYDDPYTAQYGHKFNGYLLIIEDKAGVELFRKASPSNKKGNWKSSDTFHPTKSSSSRALHSKLWPPLRRIRLQVQEIQNLIHDFTRFQLVYIDDFIESGIIRLSLLHQLFNFCKRVRASQKRSSRIIPYPSKNGFRADA